MRVVNAKTVGTRIFAGICYILSVAGLVWTYSLNAIIALICGVLFVYLINFAHWLVAYIDMVEEEGVVVQE